MKYNISPLIMVIFLCGCGDNDISAVKKLKISSDTEFTYGQILDNREICSKTEWLSDPEKKSITYQCTFKKGKVSYNFDDDYAKKLKQEVYERTLSTNSNNTPMLISKEEKTIQNKTALINDWHKTLNNPDNIFSPDYRSSMPDMTLDSKAFNNWLSDSSNKDKVEQIRKLIPLWVYWQRFDPFEAYPKIISNDFAEKTCHTPSPTINSDDENCIQIQQQLQNELISMLNAVSNEVKKTLSVDINKEITNISNDINKSKDNITYLNSSQKKNDDIQNANNSAELAVKAYSLTHVLYGVEFITWEYNKATNSYFVKSAGIKSYEYGGTYTIGTINIPLIIYSATKNVNDIDEYMALYRTSAQARAYAQICAITQDC